MKEVQETTRPRICASKSTKLLGIPLAAVLIGCSTPQSEYRTKVVDNTGRETEVVVKDTKGKPIMVSEKSIDKLEKAKAALKSRIEGNLRAKAQAGNFYIRYRIPTDAEIKSIAGYTLSPSEMDALRALAESITRDAEVKIVSPLWAESIKNRAFPLAKQMMDKGEYAKAREIVWRASTTGVAAVDDQVRKSGYEFLNTQVNPRQWKSIEKNMRDKVLAYEKDGAYDDGVAWLKTVPKVREYSTVLDSQLSNVKAELVKLSIADEDIKPIVEGTKELVRCAARIYDEADSTTNTVSGVQSDAELAAYKAKLDEYRETLIRFNCTKENADKIVAAFKKDVSPLLDPLYTSESTSKAFLYLGTAALNKRIEAFRERLTNWLTKKRTLKEDVAALIAEGKFEEARKVIKEDVEAVTIAPDTKVVTKHGKKPAAKKKTAAFSVASAPAQGDAAAPVNATESKAIAMLSDANASEDPIEPFDLVFFGELFRGTVRSLVNRGNYVAAREFIWQVCYPEEHTVLTRFLQPIGREMMQVCVNPTNWTDIECDVTNTVAHFVKEGAYTNAVAWLEAYPLIKVYAAEVDAKLGAAASEAKFLGVDADVVDPAVSTTEDNTAESDKIADRTDDVKDFVVPGKIIDLERFEKLLAEYRSVLVKNDCTQENADALVNNFREAIEPHFKGITEPKSIQTLYLGCNGLNERIKSLVAAKIEEVKQLHAEAIEKEKEIAAHNAKMQAIIDDLVARVIALVKEEKFTEARELIRDVELVQDVNWDARIYATRIGLLNSLVNPRQYEKLAGEIEAQIKEFVDDGDYIALKEYADNYPYVHDTYQHILDAIDQIKDAMLAMPIREPKTIAYIEQLKIRINDIMERRSGELVYDQDFSALEKALEELQKAYIEQHYNEFAAKNLCEVIYAEVKALLDGEFAPMTTCELNERLRRLFAVAMEGIDGRIARQKEQIELDKKAKEYAELLSKIDEDVSFDAQIAMAEDAISKQLGIVCPCAHLEMNAVLGNYARILRLMKRGEEISSAEATTLLVGATYLGQTAMFKHALELKADVNAPADRDPRGRPAILVAIETCHPEFLRLVHEAKGSQTVVDANGNTALHYAMKNGNLAVARAVAKAVDVTAVNKDGETALFMAVRRNQAKPVEFLIGLVNGTDDAATAAARKAFVDKKNNKGLDAFTLACRHDVNRVLDVLFAAGAEFDTSHLVDAAKANRIAIVQWLVEHGADVNAEGVMEAAFGSPDDEATKSYKYLVAEGGIALKRTPKCCKDTRDELKKSQEELEKVRGELSEAKKCKNDSHAEVTGSVLFDLKK